MSAFKTAVHGILLGAIIGGSAYGAMRKQAQHAQDQLIDSVRVIQEDFKNPTASSIHQKTENRSQVVDRINALVARREREGFEANETVRSWQKLLFDRIKWAL